MLAFDLSSVGNSLLSGAGVVVVGAVGTALMARRRATKVVRRTLESQVNEMHLALVGTTPSQMNPNPQEGLLARVTRLEEQFHKNGGDSLRDQVDQLRAAVARVEGQVTP